MLAGSGDGELCSHVPQVCLLVVQIAMLMNCGCVSCKIAFVCQAHPRKRLKQHRSGALPPVSVSGVAPERVAVSLCERIVDRLRAGSTPKDCRVWLKANESKSQDQAERIVRQAMALAASELCANEVPHLALAPVVVSSLTCVCVVRRDLAWLHCLERALQAHLLLKRRCTPNLCTIELLISCAVD